MGVWEVGGGESCVRRPSSVLNTPRNHRRRRINKICTCPPPLPRRRVFRFGRPGTRCYIPHAVSFTCAFFSARYRHTHTKICIYIYISETPKNKTSIEIIKSERQQLQRRVRKRRLSRCQKKPKTHLDANAVV